MMPIHALAAAIKRAHALASLSTCTRSQVGAVVLSASGDIIGEGHNRRPCQPFLGAECARDRLQVPSGERNDIGCSHAEVAALLSTKGAICTTLVVTREPCNRCWDTIRIYKVERVVVASATRPTNPAVEWVEYHG